MLAEYGLALGGATEGGRPHINVSNWITLFLNEPAAVLLAGGAVALFAWYVFVR